MRGRASSSREGYAQVCRRRRAPDWSDRNRTDAPARISSDGPINVAAQLYNPPGALRPPPDAKSGVQSSNQADKARPLYFPPTGATEIRWGAYGFWTASVRTRNSRVCPHLRPPLCRRSWWPGVSGADDRGLAWSSARDITRYRVACIPHSSWRRNASQLRRRTCALARRQQNYRRARLAPRRILQRPRDGHDDDSPAPGGGCIQ